MKTFSPYSSQSANASRATALPWNIYGDQRDSISQLDSGWIQSYAAGAVAEDKFAQIFGRRYTGLTESYRTQDAEYILITLGTIAGLVKETVDRLRERGERVGLLRLRYLRPFPNKEIADAVKNARAAAVLEKDISFGNEGTVYTNVCSALQKAGVCIPTSNYVGGLGGRNISAEEIGEIFSEMKAERGKIAFLGIGGEGA